MEIREVEAKKKFMEVEIGNLISKKVYEFKKDTGLWMTGLDVRLNFRAKIQAKSGQTEVDYMHPEVNISVELP